jgi:diamine N-acetyltransferase
MITTGRTDAPTLARAEDASLTAVQALAERVWRTHYPGIITPDQIDYMLRRSYALPVLAGFLHRTDAGIELAYMQSELAGFAAWYLMDDGAAAKLDRLYVAAECQRRGIGGRLVARVVELARAAGAVRVVLNVNKHNVQAQRAYRKHGFAVREAVVVDIGQGYVMDDYVMERLL